MRRRCSKSAECAERAPQRERRRAWRAPALRPVCGGCGSGRACLRGSSELCCCHMELSGSATAAAATAAISSMLGDHAGRPFDECRLQRGAVHCAQYTSCRRTRTMGAREEHSHVARASTWLFLSRSRLDRNHSCTHSTLVLALVETFAWWTLACFWRWRVNALDSAEENGCARTAVGCSSSWAGCASEHPSGRTARDDFSNLSF